MRDKHRLCKRLRWLFIFAILIFSLYLPTSVSAEVAGFTVQTLSLQPGSDTQSLNLNWYADKKAVNTKVRFDDGKSTIIVKASLEAASEYTVCKATVNGLAAGTTYKYQISNDGGKNWSKKYTYHTAEEGDFRFAFVGDPQLTSGNQDSSSLGTTGGKNASELTILQGWQDTLFKLQKADIDLIVSAGDQVNTYAGNEKDYELLLAPSFMQMIPFAVTVGNHDRHIEFTTHFNLPNEQDVSATIGTSSAATAETSLSGNYFYSFNHALFVVLNDADYPYSKESAVPYIQAFHDTLEAAVTKYPDYEWLFVQHHKSTESVAEHAADADIVSYKEAGFEKLMDEFHVDFVLAGHDHVYVRTYALANGKVVNKNKDELTDPDGTVYVTCNTSSGLKYYNMYYTEGYPAAVLIAEQTRIPSYSIVDVSSEKVTFTTYSLYDDNDNSTSEILDTFSITKTANIQPVTKETIMKKLCEYYKSGDISKKSLYFILKIKLENSNLVSFRYELNAKCNRPYISSRARAALLSYIQQLESSDNQ